jgi:Na+-driven multidrug efflux pump
MSSHPNELSTYRKILGLAIPVGLETVFQTILGNGILPSGGDTKFVLAGHLIGSYLVGLPAAVLLGIFAGLNAWAVFGARAGEEIIKVIAFLLRFRTPAWYRKFVDGLSQSPSDQRYHRTQFK